MYRELVRVIHDPEGVERIPLRSLDMSSGIFPDIPSAIGIDERSIANAEFHSGCELYVLKYKAQRYLRLSLGFALIY